MWACTFFRHHKRISILYIVFELGKRFPLAKDAGHLF